MQFHLNGFNPGDPRFADPMDAVVAPPLKRPLPEYVDVLIVGCGPAGLNLAAQLSQFGDISVAIVEQKDDRLLVGQADGIACRTLEMFQAYGFADQVIQEACQISEAAFWKPDANHPEQIIRSGKVQDVADDLSEMPHLIINQARIHDMFLEVMRQGPGKVEPHYQRKLLGLEVDPEGGEYPVTVKLERGVNYSQYSQEIETVKARYVVGCDGARSSVRNAIGQELVGDALNQAWGVMDVLLNTDFPDIRLKSLIHSNNEGNMLIIPREGGYMARLYIELDKLKENERVARNEMTADVLIAGANRIMQPYTIDVKEVAWWSVYEIGQRITTAFDDSTPERPARVFLAGDACHTHSPKAGQGLNTSVMDTWNLGWKLAHVLTGLAEEDLLKTYSAERREYGQALIDFDREFSRMFSARPKSAEYPEGVDPAGFQRYFQLFGQYTAGVSIQYKPSVLVSDDRYQYLASGLTVGKRFHSAPVIRQGDAKPVQLGHCHTANGAYRIYAFGGSADAMSDQCGVNALCDFLANDPRSPLLRHTPAGADRDTVIDVRAVFNQPHQTLETGSIHPVLAPQKGKYGLRDYEKVFCADHRPESSGGGQNIYDLRGIHKAQGCLVIVRPDQYVADVLPLDDYTRLTALFEGLLKLQ
ncbi:MULTISPECIES: FAD-dependent monooxygenase [unclassified Oceanobacter]|uniref:FAD-dependent monooxygenase n=1 Tax=unclassified Oceanobacter TaxID=2620260 RepID=UPI002736354B|nr:MULTISPECIES: FAD-dependent monooxygenase [unclassified Oceanobacter]MDP2609113.1 FAD-dependent monooxygenase [Oceanobacter sp. 1_MG-2023]MDP2612435.1 FAD-dependent monooxygenase [Oceanobacter sp. 2_MG-2023]